MKLGLRHEIGFGLLVMVGVNASSAMAGPTATGGNASSKREPTSRPATKPQADATCDQAYSRFDCGLNNMFCVNVCTGRVCPADSHTFLSESSQVHIRLVGVEECRPKAAWFTSHHVVNLNVGQRSEPKNAPPEETRKSEDNGAVKPGPKEDARAAAARAEDAKQKAEEAAAKLAAKADTSNEVAVAIADVAAAEAAVAAAEAVQTTDKTQKSKNDTSLSDNAATQSKLVNFSSICKVTPDEFGGNHVELATHTTTAKDKTQATKDALDRAGAAISAKLNHDDTAIAKAKAYAKAAAEYEAAVTAAKPEATVKKAKKDALDGARAAWATAAGEAATKDQEVTNLLTKVAKAEREALQAREFLRAFWAHVKTEMFGDVLVTIPKDQTLLEFNVNVNVQRPTSIENVPSPGTLGTAVAAGTTTAPATPANSNPIDPDVIKAEVPIKVSHGKYYWDIGVMYAIAPHGTNEVSTQQRPGTAGDYALLETQKRKSLVGVALNLYPFGHRRGSFSAFENKFTVGDLVGLQVAFNPDAKSLPSTLFGGVILEPIAGVSLSGGVVFLKGNYLKKNFVDGMSTSAQPSDYLEEDTRPYGYVGLTMSYELFNMATKSSQPQSLTQ